MKKEPIVLPSDPADAEDFDVAAGAMDRGQRARLIRRTRTGLGLSQTEFAERFCVPVGTLRDWEQARATAPDFAIAYCRTLSELSAIMLRARLVVANDCGPSHIAQGACVPYVGIFNEPNPEWFWDRPYSAAVVPPHPKDGIDAITPDDVLHACQNVLDHHAHSSYAG